VVVRGPSCILEGALRFASARFGEGRDRWSIVREKLTHVVDLSDTPCPSKCTITSEFRHNNTSNLRDGKLTPDQSGMTVMEASFFFNPAIHGRSDGELRLHENCGNPYSVVRDLGRIVIREDDISGLRSKMLLKVKLDISEEGLLCRKPALEMSCGTQLPITWKSSSLSLSNNKRMEDVRVQLAEEMKTFHPTK
jgi:hypothetical protein